MSPASVAVVHILDGQGGTVAGVPEARCYRFVELFEEHEYVGFFASGASLLGVPLPLPPYRVEFSGNNVAGRVAGWWQFGPPRPPEHVVARPPPAVQSLLPSRGSGAVDSGLAGLASALGAVEDGVGGGRRWPEVAVMPHLGVGPLLVCPLQLRLLIFEFWPRRLLAEMTLDGTFATLLLFSLRTSCPLGALGGRGRRFGVFVTWVSMEERQLGGTIVVPPIID